MTDHEYCQTAPPRRHPDRFNECQIAVDDRVLALLGDAATTGWDKDDVLAAIIEITDNTALALTATMLLSVEPEPALLRKLKDV